MRKRLRKRYTSEGQILAEIDYAHAQIETLNALAEAQDLKLKVMRNSMWDSEQVDAVKKQASAYRDEASRIETEKLERLGEALAEFRTQVFACMTDDASVPAIAWKDKYASPIR